MEFAILNKYKNDWKYIWVVKKKELDNSKTSSAHRTPHTTPTTTTTTTVLYFFLFFFFVEKLFSTSLVCLKQLSQPNHGNGMGHITYTDTDADIPAKSPPINNKTQNI